MTNWSQFSETCEIWTGNKQRKKPYQGLWSYYYTSEKIFQCMLTKLPITQWGFLGQTLL
jgi:hypothetical protein